MSDFTDVSASDEHLESLVGQLRVQLVDLAHDPTTAMRSRDDVHARAKELVENAAALLPVDTRAQLVEQLMVATTGLGPIEPLLADPGVDEVMVNGLGDVWIERAGRVERTGVSFGDEAELEHVIDRVLAPVGRRVDEAAPICDARLADGSRVNVVIPPLAIDGPVLTIRRFRHRGYSVDELEAVGTMTAAMRALLAECVRQRISMLISGGTGSGKTTTLNALSAHIPAGERIVTIEDAAELRLQQPHVVRLEARPPNVEGSGEVTIRMLVRNALRMRPDRIVVGEVRGGEALDMLSALNTGHDGGLTTIHANSAAAALARVETLALMGGVEVPHAAIRGQIASAIELVVHQQRAADGSRRIVSMLEVCPQASSGYGTRRVCDRGLGGDEWGHPSGDRLAACWNAAGMPALTEAGGR